MHSKKPKGEVNHGGTQIHTGDRRILQKETKETKVHCGREPVSGAVGTPRPTLQMSCSLTGFGVTAGALAEIDFDEFVGSSGGPERFGCGLPSFQSIFESLFDGAHFHASVEQFRNVENAIGTWGRSCVPIKIDVIFPELKSAPGFEHTFDLLDDIAGSDSARVGDVVSAEWRAKIPEVETNADEVTAM